MFRTTDAEKGEVYYCSKCKDWFRAKFSGAPAGVQ